MSADNWAQCPRCVDRAERAAAALRAEAEATYGVLPVAEWEALRDKAAQPVSIDNSFREDYEIGLDGREFFIRYSGSCSVCKLTHEFTLDEPIYSGDGGKETR